MNDITKIDRETKVLFLKILKNGYFSKEDIKTINKKAGYDMDKRFPDEIRIGYC